MSENYQAYPISENFFPPAAPSYLPKKVGQETLSLLKTTEKWHDRPIVPGLVIDPKECYTRDNALWVLSDTIVLVSMSDVTALVQEKSSLDKLAHLRSLYQKSSLFPSVLAQEKFSLGQRKPCGAMTVAIELAKEDLELEDIAIFPSVLISPHDFTYADVAQIYYHDKHPLHTQVQQAFRLSQKLHEKEKLHPKVTRRDSLVEEKHMATMVSTFMQLANKAVAAFAYIYNVPILYKDGGFLTTEPNLSADFRYLSTSITAPIRRYQDIQTWRVIKNFLTAEDPLTLFYLQVQDSLEKEIQQYKEFLPLAS